MHAPRIYVDFNEMPNNDEVLLSQHDTMAAAKRRAGELEDPSNRNRFGPLYRTCCHPVHGNGPGGATVGGASQLGAGPVRQRGRAFIRTATSVPLRATSHGAPPQGFHARGRVGRLMNG